MVPTQSTRREGLVQQQHAPVHVAGEVEPMARTLHDEEPHATLKEHHACLVFWADLQASCA